MNTGKIEMHILSEADFEDPHRKNEIIQTGLHPALLFANKNDTNDAELLETLSSNPFLAEYDAVAFGTGLPSGQVDGFSVLSCPDSRLYALLIKRSVFAECGSFNGKLGAGSNFEFLCRVSDRMSVFWVECAPDQTNSDPAPDQAVLSHDLPLAYAYTVCSMQTTHPGSERFEQSLQSLLARLSTGPVLTPFLSALKSFSASPEMRNEYRQETAPILFLCDSETCYGVPRFFSHRLAKALAQKGCAVTIAPHSGMTGEELQQLLQKPCKAIIGFQVAALESPLFRALRCPRFQFWFDNPIYFGQSFFRDPSPDYHVLCQDGGYAAFIRKYYASKNAIHFSPGGDAPDLPRQALFDKERPLDLVFLGTFRKESKHFTEPGSDTLYRYLLEHPSETFEEAFAHALPEMIPADPLQFAGLLARYRNVFDCITNHFRTQTVETILSSGLSLHVYGDSWDEYDGPGKELLIRHPAVSPEDSLSVLQSAKLSLNIMTWHKDGRTERVIHSMLSGAVCVSDETAYLRAHYVDGQELILFRLSEIKQLPGRIRELLQNDMARKDMAVKAYDHALRTETWEDRADDILQMIRDCKS